ncbi:MAG: F0F1 ATP synthase subunit A [Gemmataceae bacterium]
MAHNAIEHVLDTTTPSKPEFPLFTHLFGEEGLSIPLFSLDGYGIPFALTRYMLIEVLVAVVIIAIYVPLARRIATGKPPKGAWWNFFEELLTFVRDKIARPAIVGEGGSSHHGEGHDDHGHEGHGHDGHHQVDPVKIMDQAVPFLWTVFLFILLCNLFGLVPMLGSPTSSLYVTAALALMSFFIQHGLGIYNKGFVGYIQSLWPPMDMPLALAIFVKPLLFFLEVIVGPIIKSSVLAIRLFANLFAGHLVLATVLFFIANAASLSFGPRIGITIASVFGVLAISFLELFVAFLQAYIFTYLTAIYIGLQTNPSH